MLVRLTVEEWLSYDMSLCKLVVTAQSRLSWKNETNIYHRKEGEAEL